MPIAGKPIYAGDVNTLAQLDLQRTIAQQKATQEAIAGASRGAQNWMKGFGQQQAMADQKTEFGLKERELGIKEQEAKNRSDYYSSQAEATAFREAMDGIQQGIFDEEEIPGLMEGFQNPTYRKSLEAAKKRLGTLNAQLEEQGPGWVDQFNKQMQPSLDRLQSEQAKLDQMVEDRSRREAGLAQGGWGANIAEATGWGTSEEDVNRQRQRVGQITADIGAAQAQFEKDNPLISGRYSQGLTPEGRIQFQWQPRKKSPLPQTGGGGGSTSPGEAAPTTGREPLPPPPVGQVPGPDVATGPAPPAPMPPAPAQGAARAWTDEDLRAFGLPTAAEQPGWFSPEQPIPNARAGVQIAPEVAAPPLPNAPAGVPITREEAEMPMGAETRTQGQMVADALANMSFPGSRRETGMELTPTATEAQVDEAIARSQQGAVRRGLGAAARGVQRFFTEPMSEENRQRQQQIMSQWRGFGPPGGAGAGQPPPVETTSPTAGTTLDVRSVSINPATGQYTGVDQQGNTVDVSAVLTPEIRSQYQSFVTSLLQQGVSSDESERRAGLWLAQQLRAAGARNAGTR